MIQIENIDGAPHQRHTIIMGESEVDLSIRFLPTVEMWILDVTYGDRSAYGFKLSVGVLHMESQNFPFDFIVEDSSGSGLDPFKIDDFESDRCRLYMLDADEMEIWRNAPVPL